MPATRLVGRPAETPGEWCDLAEALGWDAICAGGVNINAPGGASEIACDGTQHDVPRGIEGPATLAERAGTVHVGTVPALPVAATASGAQAGGPPACSANHRSKL